MSSTEEETDAESSQKQPDEEKKNNDMKPTLEAENDQSEGDIEQPTISNSNSKKVDREPKKQILDTDETEIVAKPQRCSNRMVVIGALILVVIALAVGLGVGLSKRNNSNDFITKNAGSIPFAYSCSKDNDCEIKDVRNCCGYYPKCVNTDYEPKSGNACKGGMSGVCGFPSINKCVCTGGECEGLFM